MVFAKSRFSFFYWWLTCCWTAKASCPGVCYANGAYHPIDKMKQAFPDVKGVTELSVETVSKPLANINITDAEILVGSVFAIFYECENPLSLLPFINYSQILYLQRCHIQAHISSTTPVITTRSAWLLYPRMPSWKPKVHQDLLTSHWSSLRLR